MKMLQIVVGLLLIVGLLVIGCAPAAPPAEAYPAKQITWLVPASPGGGYDTIARTYSKELPNFLPTPQDIYIVNLPGLAGRKTASTLNKAAPDGYTIGYLTGGMAATQVLHGPELDFDVTTFAAIGSPFGSRYAVWVRADSDIQSMDDLLALGDKWRTILYKPGETAYAVSKCWLDTFDVNPTEVPPGAEEEDVLILRGDVEAMVGVIGRLSAFIASGDLRPILIFRNERDAALPDVPCLADIGKEIPLAIDVTRYQLWAPPGTPSEITSVLQEAFRRASDTATLKDFATNTNRWLDWKGAEFQREFQKSQLEVAQKYPQWYE